ncbi:MAG: phosphoglucosamine mutase [Candidatus Wallbacteria bacterium]|nr:phosphoglucosamine mutase [Candidatus Wallbacteria bacterium]
MPELFGTDGVRGVANRSPMTPHEVLRLGQAAGRWLGSTGRTGPVLIGRDTRLSGPMIEAALVSGLTSAGVPVMLGGVLPTPAVSFATRHMGLAAGAVVSASHNPYEDNGVKFFLANGGKLSEADEDAIEALLAEEPAGLLAAGDAVGTVSVSRGLLQAYIAHAVATAAGPGALSGWTVVCDCANGAASRSTPAALRRLGAKVFALHTRPDGTNINRGCGSLHFEVVRRAVLARPGAVGISHDGDADRVLMCDEAGELVDGDRMMGVLARDMVGRSALPGGVLVATILSNAGLEEALEPLGVRVARAQVGDRKVADEMARLGAAVGGEPSGHIILAQNGPTGDGLLTALAVLGIAARTRTTLHELASLVRLYPQHSGAVRIARKPPLEQLEPVSAAIRHAREQVAPRGRVVVRYSGTEPVARVLVEGPEAELVRSLGQQIENALRGAIGAE